MGKTPLSLVQYHVGGSKGASICEALSSFISSLDDYGIMLEFKVLLSL